MYHGMELLSLSMFEWPQISLARKEVVKTTLTNVSTPDLSNEYELDEDTNMWHEYNTT